MSDVREKFKVIITDCATIRGEPTIEREVLSKVGAEVYLLQTRNEPEIIDRASDADCLLVDSAKITRKIIQSLVKLKGIVAMAIGYDNIDVDAATEGGIYVCNVPDYCLNEVADHTLGLILALIRKIPWYHLATKSGKWDVNEFKPIPHLDGQTAGIIGFGNIGRGVAERLKAFGLQLLIYDPYLRESLIIQYGGKPVDLPTLMKKSDIVTIHVPLTKDTYHLIYWRKRDKSDAENGDIGQHFEG